MNKNEITMQNLLSEWGRAQHQNPESNLELKSKILGNFSVSAAQVNISKKSFHTPWLSLLFTAVALFTLFIMPGKPDFKTYETAIPAAQNGSLRQKTIPATNQTTAVDDSQNPLANMLPPVNNNPTTNHQQPAALNTTPIPSPSGMLSPSWSAASAQPQLKIPSNTGETKSINIPAYNQAAADKFKNPQILEQPKSYVTISDNREFLKTNYSASVLTRSVQDLSNSIQTIIRGFGGRIDSSSNSNKIGYINFVVPADKFSAFSQQIKNLIGERFYKESIQTQNLLPQKKDIESDQKTAEDALTQLNAEKERLTKNHNLVAGSIRSQINSYNAQLTALQNQRIDNLQQYLDIQAQKTELQNAIQALQNNLTQENNNFAKQIAAANSYVQNAQNNLQTANQQNSDLLDTVATVHGSITLNWISIWEFINFYVPLYWISLVLIVCAIAAYFFRRRSVIVLP